MITVNHTQRPIPAPLAPPHGIPARAKSQLPIIGKGNSHSKRKRKLKILFVVIAIVVVIAVIAGLVILSAIEDSEDDY